jgi:hypothetical protein
MTFLAIKAFFKDLDSQTIFSTVSIANNMSSILSEKELPVKLSACWYIE